MITENKQYLDSGPRIFPVPYADLVDMFETTSARHADKVIYYYLDDGFNETSRITFREMNATVKSIAASLQKDFRKGDRALLLFPSGIEFIVSLFGCFYSGITGVPAYPPRKNRMFARFEAIVNDCSPSLIITTAKIRDDIQKNFSQEACLQNIKILIYEDLAGGTESQWENPRPVPGDIALLQYTSGSTGTPNGVIVTHENILQNSEFIKRAFGHDETAFGVNWLPGFHDMGLIGALFQPPYLGGTNVIIPPNAFLLRPMNWLRAISRYRATTAGGPNFALDFCADRFKEEELEGADLSSVRPFYCGAEPVRKESLERFSGLFQRYGFDATQFYPCYGLAESVLIVTGGGLDEKPVYCTVDAREIEKGMVHLVPEDHPNARTFVSCGYPWQNTEVCIVDPKSYTVNPKSIIGEIWVSGPSVAKGYWNNPEETQRTFGAYLAGSGEGPFLRTGDLGFIHEGHLFISGRIKDLIIIRGLNHYPTDIEHTVSNAHEAIQPGAVAAFALEGATGEQLGIVCEIRRTHLRDLEPKAVFEAVRQAVAGDHQLQTHAIGLIRPGSIPKTSSGKIQRLATRNEFREGLLDLVADWIADTEEQPVADVQGPAPDSSTEEMVLEWLLGWMEKELKLPAASIDITKPVTAYGLDSLKAVILAREAEDRFGVEWPLEFFLEETTVQLIARKGKELLAGRDGTH